MEITENYSIGKKNQKNVRNHRGAMSIVLLEKKEIKKNPKSPWIRLADYALKTNEKTELTVD